MKRYDDTVFLPRPQGFKEKEGYGEYPEKFNRAVRKALEDIHDIANLNLVQPAAFSVHKGGTDQTGIVTNTWTKVTFDTEIYDINSEFASDKFTPSARVVQMNAAVSFDDIGDGKTGIIALYKNGSEFKLGERNVNGAADDMRLTSSWEDKANGTDYYEIFAWHNHGSNRDIFGASARTYFMGH